MSPRPDLFLHKAKITLFLDTKIALPLLICHGISCGDISEKEVGANENSPRHIRKGGANEISDFNQRERKSLT